MKNFSAKNEETEKLASIMYAALNGGTEEEQKEAIHNYMTSIRTSLESQAQDMMEEIGEKYQDERVLVERGVIQPMTSEERTYFNEAAEKESFDNLIATFPETKVEDVFSRLTEEHPIISRVDSVATKGLIKYIYTDPTKALAFWGSVPSDIREIILQGFKEISLETNKLSGYVAVTKGYFKLGPAWLSAFITTALTEIMSATLELAIVQGTGLKQPIGMIRKLSGISDAGYPEKDLIVIKDLEPETLGPIHGGLSEAKTDNGRVSCLVHPQTYWAKIFPKIAQKDKDNNWHLTNLVTGDEIIQSHAVPEDRLIFGVLENYFLAVGGQMEIVEYKETFAIEDMDVYIAKFYGNGTAKNPNAFFVGDISTMPGGTPVKLEGDPDIKNPGTMTEPKKKKGTTDGAEDKKTK